MIASPDHLDSVGDRSSLLGGRECDYKAQTGVVHLAIVVDDTSFQALYRGRVTRPSGRRYNQSISVMIGVIIVMIGVIIS